MYPTVPPNELYLKIREFGDPFIIESNTNCEKISGITQSRQTKKWIRNVMMAKVHRHSEM